MYSRVPFESVGVKNYFWVGEKFNLWFLCQKKRFPEIFDQNRSNSGVLANFCPNNYGNAWRGSILPKNAKTGFRLGMDDEKELGGGNGQSGLNPALKSIIRKFSKKPGRTKLLDLATWMFNYYVSIVNLIIKRYFYMFRIRFLQIAASC